MAIFTESEAKHFFSVPPTSAPTSFKVWSDALPNGFLSEGQPEFISLQNLAHQEVERSMLLAAAHYRRAHDLLSPVSAPWAFVTLYYGSFFAARALLGALGAWKLGKSRVLQVVSTTPLSQRFQVHKSNSSYRGSHEQFWDFYFSNVVSLAPSASPIEKFSLSPISADVTWLTSRRNDVNYDSFVACDLAELHSAGFDVTNFPATLPGELATKYRFLESLLTLANRVCGNVGINSNALNSVSGSPTRSGRVRDLVLSTRPPGLASKVKKRVATG